MCVFMCACVCAGRACVREHLCVRVRVCMCMCVCQCACVRMSRACASRACVHRLCIRASVTHRGSKHFSRTKIRCARRGNRSMDADGDSNGDSDLARALDGLSDDGELAPLELEAALDTLSDGVAGEGPSPNAAGGSPAPLAEDPGGAPPDSPDPVPAPGSPGAPAVAPPPPPVPALACRRPTAPSAPVAPPGVAAAEPLVRLA